MSCLSDGKSILLAELPNPDCLGSEQNPMGFSFNTNKVYFDHADSSTRTVHNCMFSPLPHKHKCHVVSCCLQQLVLREDKSNEEDPVEMGSVSARALL